MTGFEERPADVVVAHVLGHVGLEVNDMISQDGSPWWAWFLNWSWFRWPFGG